MKHIIVSLVVVGAIALMGGCSSTAVKRDVVAVNQPKGKLKTAVVDNSPQREQISLRAFNLFVNGSIYEELDDLVSAAQNYKNALQIHPTSYEIRYSLANVLFRMEQFENALETLEYINPVDVPALELQASCYRYLGQKGNIHDTYLHVIRLDSLNTMAYSYLSSIYRRNGDIDSVIWAYENLIRIRPANYRLWSELGKLYAEKRQFSDAKRALHKSIELVADETNLMTFARLGELYEMTQVPDSALTVYKEGLSVVPNDVLLNRMTANLYVNLDSIPQAIPYAVAVVELSPMDKAAARRLGSIYFGADSLAQADSIFSTLVEMSDFHPVNYYYLGRIAIADEDFERARDNFMRLTQVADTLVDSWLDLAFAYRRLNQTENEITTYKTGLNHMRNEASAIRLLFGLGAAYERTGRAEEAIEVFEELIAQVPDNADALNFLGYLLADRGERLKYAKKLIERALQVSPENAAFLDSYGWVAFRLGSFQEAVEFLNRAVALDNDPVIFDHLGDAYRATGDMEQAQKWWRKALELSPDDEIIKEKLGH